MTTECLARGVEDMQVEYGIDTDNDGYTGNLGDCDPCFDWKNHGQFVDCVIEVANTWLQAGLIDKNQKGDIVSDATQSDVGKKPKSNNKGGKKK